MKNELQRHKRSDKIKWAFTGIVFVLLFVMVTGLCLQLFGTGKVKPSEWFKKADNEQTEELPEGDENEGGADETAAVSSVTPLSAVKFLSAVSDNDGISTQSLSPVSSTVSVKSIDGSRNFGSFLYNASVTDCTHETYTGTEYCRATITISGTLACASGYDYYNFKLYFGDTPKVGSGSGYSVDIEIVSSTQLKITYERIDPYCILKVGSLSAALPSMNIRCERAKPLPADPVKEGYTFVGWYYDEAYTQPYDGEPIYEDTALYAKFEINRYTVTFNSDGGSAVASQTVDWNTAATLSTPTRDKYAFKGWYLPNGTQYTNQPIKENTTLTAQWERNVFTVTFETEGGSAVASQEVNLNSSVTLPTTTRTGYVFKGWYLADGTEYTDQGITADITLTAHWEVQTFTVTFYVDGEVYETMTVDYGTPLVPAASEFNLNVMSVTSESGAPSIDEEGTIVVEENCSVEAVKMNTVDQTINTMKQNKWAIIGGVAGGVALIAVVAAICGGVKHKRKR